MMIRALISIFATLALFSFAVLGAASSSSTEYDTKDMPGYQKFWSLGNAEHGMLKKDEFELRGNRLVLKTNSRERLAKKKQNKFTRPNLWHMRQG